MTKSDALAPPRDYLKTYSLSCEPFANTLDGRFFYAGPALMQRLDLLTHLTQFGDSVILVSGPTGSGKTTLLGRFVAQTGKQWRLCLINADEFVQFRQRLGDALGIGDSGDEQQILEQWASRQDASQLLVIVIDNSQQLQPDALHKLCTLLSRPEGDRVRLILFGTPEAQQAVRQALDQKTLPCTAQLLEIPKLSEEETAAYLMYRLAVAGYSGESPFTATEVRAICKAADGRPAAINRLAHDALLEHQMRARSKRISPRPPGWMAKTSTWAAASLLVAGIAFYLGWQRLQPEPEAVIDSARELSESPGREVPLALPDPAPPPESAPAQVAQLPDTLASPAQPEPDITEPSAPTETAVEDALATTPPPVDLPAAEQPAPVASDTTLQPQQPPPSETTPAKTDTASQTGPGPSGPVQPAQPETVAATTDSAPQAEAEPAGQPAATQTAAARTEPVPATAPATPPPAQAPGQQAPAPSTPTAPQREAWLLQQPPGHYSLQLLGSRQEASILTYISKNRLDPQQCAFYHGKFQGGDWYVLLYGVYPDRASALAARGTLPARVQKEKPWPRSLASVQTAIRELQ